MNLRHSHPSVERLRELAEEGRRDAEREAAATAAALARLAGLESLLAAPGPPTSDGQESAPPSAADVRSSSEDPEPVAPSPPSSREPDTRPSGGRFRHLLRVRDGHGGTREE